MRFRNTILAFLVLIGLGVFIYYYEYRGEDAREALAESDSNALSFERDQVRVLEITKPPGEPLRLSKETDGWSLSSPLQTRADGEKVASLLGGLSSLRVVRVLDGVGENELGEFKLKEPAVRVKLTMGEGAGELTLDLGDKAPIGNEYYARRPGAAEVLLVSGGAWQIISADAASLRYKKLVGIESWKVARFQIENGSETVGFVRGVGAEEWRLEQPISFPADGLKVQGLWLDLQSAEAEGFESEHATPGDLQRLGLDRPALTVTIRPMSEEGAGAEPAMAPREKSPVRVIFSAPAPDGAVYARRDDTPAVMRLGKDIYEKLNQVVTDLSGYRDHRAVPVDRWKLSMIEVQRATGAVTIFKNDEDSSWHWGSADGAVLPPEQVNALIDAMEAIRATGFIDGAAAVQSMSELQAALSVTLREGTGVTARTVSMRIHGQGAGVNESSAQRRVTSSASSSIYLVPDAAVQTLLDQAMALAQPPAQTGAQSAPVVQPGETKQP